MKLNIASSTAFGLCLLEAASPAAASTISGRQTSKAKTQISTSVYNTLVYYGRYCSTYTTAPCQHPPPNTVVQGYVNADPDAQMTLFRSDADRELVMAFPGTSSLQDVLTDIDAILVPYVSPGVSGCENCKVHKGLLAAFNGLQPQTKQVLDDAMRQFPNYAVKIVGHSLGASMAKMAYTSFRAQGYPIAQGISYGEFRAGDQAFADFVDSLSGDTDAEPTTGNFYRVTHADDGVPQILAQSAGYRHSRSEYWFAKGADPTTSYRCYGQEAADCNNSEVPGPGVLGINTAHVSYPGVNVTACGGYLE